MSQPCCDNVAISKGKNHILVSASLEIREGNHIIYSASRKEQKREGKALKMELLKKKGGGGREFTLKKLKLEVAVVLGIIILSLLHINI